MHAFLLISQSSNLKSQIKDLAKKLKAKAFEFPIGKIEDVRNLNNFIKLSLSESTLVVCRNIHEATTEALNAFLKNLEEPQSNLYFALTAPSVRKILPTIVSRCQIVKIKNLKFKIKNFEKAEQFLKATTGRKLTFIDKVRDREEAIQLIEDIISYQHGLLHSNKVDLAMIVSHIEKAIACLACLKANGNISLQLTNFVVSLV